MSGPYPTPYRTAVPPLIPGSANLAVLQVGTAKIQKIFYLSRETKRGKAKFMIKNADSVLPILFIQVMEFATSLNLLASA